MKTDLTMVTPDELSPFEDSSHSLTNGNIQITSATLLQYSTYHMSYSIR